MGKPDRATALVSVGDAACRARIVDALQRQGWTVVEQPTGFHLLRAIADVIEGHPHTSADESGALPGLLVVDAIARGCSGLTIAAGLRELGVRIPLVLVARSGDPIPESDDPATRIAGPRDAVAAVAEIARECFAANRASSSAIGACRDSSSSTGSSSLAS